jgi:hypothetical protein
MFQQDPQQRLWLINQRNTELVHAAEQERLARAHSDGPARHPRTGPLASLRAGLGRAFADVRGALSSEAPCAEPAAAAPCAEIGQAG